MENLTEELIIGNRYWLDVKKDVSGIYVGQDPIKGTYLFSDPQGVDCYSANEDGTIPFLDHRGFLLCEAHSN